MGSIIAPSANITGDITLQSDSTLVVGTVTNSIINVGPVSTSNYSFGGSVAFPPVSPGQLSLTTGAITDSSIESQVVITTAKIASWSNANGSTGGIVAPSIANLMVAGSFNANLEPTLATNGKALAIGSAKIGGALGGLLQTTDTGNIGSLSVGSLFQTWTCTIASIKSFTIKTDGIQSPISAANIGSLIVGGNVTGSITAASAKLIKVTGLISGTTLTFNGPGSLGSLSATGSISNTTITADGGIGSITAGSISGSNISAGVMTGTTFANATSSNLGGSSIGSFRITSPAVDAFADTDVLAGSVGSASVGSVNTSNGGTSFGIAVKTMNNFAGVFSNGKLHVSHANLLNQEVLSAYLNEQGAVLGDFSIVLNG
jgi:hypothetical protein